MWSDEEENVLVDKASWDAPLNTKVSDSDSISSEDEQNNTLYVSGLALSTSKDDLQKLFSHFGSITRVNVIDRRKPSHRYPYTTYGFVTFGCRADATAAIDQLHKTQYRDQTLEVSWCKGTKKKNAVTSHKQYDEDDGNLYRLIEVYTCAKSSDNDDLPDLNQLLQEMQEISNQPTKPYQYDDIEVNITLKAVHQSFINRITKQEGNAA